MRSRAASAVAKLPAMTSTLYVALIWRTVLMTFAEWPCAVSTMMTSTPASISASTRSNCFTPTAAPQSSLPRLSRFALGKLDSRSMSRIVIRPASALSSSTSRSFSTLFWLRMPLASSSVVPGFAVMRFVPVMTSRTSVDSSVTNLRSRPVRMPTTLPGALCRSSVEPVSVTGKPETWCLRISSRALPIVSFGPSVIGSRMMPLADLLTLVTSRAWASGVRFLWMIPMPPSWARAMARADSVTVSIGALIRGRPREMFRVRRVETSVSCGLMSLARGMSRTSSNVMPSATIL